MTTLRLHTEGIDQVEQNLAQGPQAISQGVHQGLEASTLLLEGAVKQNILSARAVNFGQLLNSVAHAVKPLGAEWVGTVGSNVKHAPPMEEGAVPHWPPWGEGSSLRLWCKRKLKDESAAFLVARAIARRGIRGRKMFENAFRDNQDRVTSIMRNAIAAAVRRING